jgi:toxin CcdB
MAQYDVFKLSDTLYVLDIQNNIFRHLKTRVVIPLLPIAEAPDENDPRLKPIINVEGQKFVLLPTDISTVLDTMLETRITNIAGHHADITAALDFLFHGF